VLELLHHRVTMGFPTFFVKVRAHRGEPYNEAADRIASTATVDEDVPLLWNASSGRIIYQFAPDASDSEDVLYLASMNDTVKKFIKNQAALSSLMMMMSFICSFRNKNETTHLPHRGLRNLSCDALTAAGIFWARVWRTRRFPTGPRNASSE